MNKRTLVDFHKHELKIINSPSYKIHWLKKLNTMDGNVKFINIDGVLIVKGDYGNWIFCRQFVPSANSSGVSDLYWIEKLKSNSTQGGKDYDAEGTVELLQRGINGGLEKYGYKGEQLKIIKDFYKIWIDWAKDAISLEEFIRMASKDMPDFIDVTEIPYVMKTKPWLATIFDAYEEIVLRLKARIG